MIWSALYNILIRSSSLERLPVFGWVWHYLWNLGIGKIQTNVTTRIHGHCIKVPFGYPYPLYARKFRTFNAPLVELAYQTYSAMGRPLCFVDVGSAIGDTFLLIHANCQGMVRKALCVEGDSSFFEILLENLAGFPNVAMARALLSSSKGEVRRLERTHPGTASALGEGTETSTNLDSIILMQPLETVDLIKIDVDGFDGEVLEGAYQTLIKDKPSVIFEWHPSLCRQTDNSYYRHFDTLKCCGYRTFIWFDKFGNFSHFTAENDRGPLDLLAEMAFSDSFCTDLHYDVIALHQNSKVSPVEVAKLGFAGKRASRY